MNGRPKTPDEIDIAVGARIRLRRRALRMSISTLAESVGLTFQQVQKYETGRNRISASVLSRIASALQVNASELLGENGSLQAQSLNWRALVADAPELVEAYSRIGDPTLRKALLQMALVIANAHAAPRESPSWGAGGKCSADAQPTCGAS